MRRSLSGPKREGERGRDEAESRSGQRTSQERKLSFLPLFKLNPQAVYKKQTFMGLHLKTRNKIVTLKITYMAKSSSTNY